jgi:Uma2 family endonuclease
MSILAETSANVWTAADLLDRLGPIPLDRIRTDPAPGTATEQDILDARDRGHRLCELIGGTLLEKTEGSYESYLAGVLFRWLANFIAENDLGIALPPDGMMRLAPGLVRIPDVSFISWQRLPGRSLPSGDIWRLVPDLAIEVLSKGNTPQEMERKLTDYFTAGVRQVWYVYPDAREVRVYTSPENFSTLGRQEILSGGDVLPGFNLDLQKLFGTPGQAG